MIDNVKAIRLPLEICTKPTDIYKSAYMKQNFSLESDDSVDIPYHARETALPFTYGDISEVLTQSQLKHVESIFDEAQFENDKQPFLKDKKKIVNKEKLQQSNDNSINKNKQIGKRGLLSKNKLNNNIVRSGKYTRKLSENVHNRIILEQNEINNELLNTSHNDLNLNRGNSKDQPIPATKDLKRCQTPSFPCEEIASFSNRSTSPYPTFSPQICSTNVKNKKNTEIVTKNITDTNTDFAKFAKDTSYFWYKPHITREEALILLGNAKPGSFILRNSTTYKNSFGLVLRVSRPPVNLAVVTDKSEFVRHYLLERTDCGVRLKGYFNEPVFTSLSAFVYQHTVDKLALPCKLVIPKTDFSLSSGQADLILVQEQLLSQGAACNVHYLFNYNTESLTGDEAIRKASNEMFFQFKYLKPYEVHFKVSKYGITLTDNKRLFFFRRHYSVQNISYFGLEPDNRLWKISHGDSEDMFRTIFAFVARPLAGGKDNQCHIFCDLSVKQPASAIISFAQKILPLTILGNKII
ncbi:LOW QUALITY PROTEIN: tensin-3-like [Bactrocera neohumeralis]|uniref:LOW QUALITY PROTEIN: tensin-3-like n=1 Tax=Bactrocera neohumeralis TaxID=98809 RepID=UPI002165925C|nr:LOW QUALITY PROTEIN: tensin-3-like [Bactrocera neohumeralis]